MASKFFLSFFGSCLLVACTDRGSAGDHDTGGADDDETTATMDVDADTDTDAEPDADADESADGGEPPGPDEGPGPDTCQGTAPRCLEDPDGPCPVIFGEMPAACEGLDWVCPDGYAFEDELRCEREDQCGLEYVLCWVGGDCGARSYAATCVGHDFTCEPGDARECEWPCEPGDVPPDDCWDQGPGECSDYAPPPNCTDGVWTCPNGFAFGGFGDRCTFPGG